MEVEGEGGVGAPVGAPEGAPEGAAVSGALLLSDGVTSSAESQAAGGADSVRLS